MDRIDMWKRVLVRSNRWAWVAAVADEVVGFSWLSTGFEFMKGLEYKKSYCWVLEGNPTIRFYERSGAVTTGLFKWDEIAGKQFKELAYEWSSLDLGG